jgi:hypothetical protein
MGDVDPSLSYTLPFQLTKTLHRQPYDKILPDRNPQIGRLILITGGGSGIGAVRQSLDLTLEFYPTYCEVQAAAKVWSSAKSEGVVITGRRLERLEKVAAELRQLPENPNILAVQADLSREGDVKALFNKINASFGRSPDVILHCAGTMCPSQPIGQSSLADWWGDYVSLQYSDTGRVTTNDDIRRKSMSSPFFWSHVLLLTLNQIQKVQVAL